MPATIDAVRVIILFIIPGFITQTVIGSTLSRRTRDASQTTVEAIVFSCIIYALGGWAFFVVPLPSLGFFTENLDFGEIVKDGLIWVGFFFVLPILFGFLLSSLAHRRWLGIHNFFGLPSVSPQPRAWDFYFSQGKQA